jgi:hypothetical protein
VYLSHINLLPQARGTVLTYWLRIAPVELAVEYLYQLQQRGLVQLPLPDQPGKNFGVQLNLAAEMEFFSPDDRLSLQRILFYGRGGFDVIDPRHFPYSQPDFRAPEVIAATGNRPVPFMLLLRRMGRERQARLPIEEASITMRHLYDEFACFCTPDLLQNSLDIVQARLAERRAKGKPDVELLPLPTGPGNLQRLKRLFRYDNLRRYYPGTSGAEDYLERIKAQLASNSEVVRGRGRGAGRRAGEDAALCLQFARQGYVGRGHGERGDDDQMTRSIHLQTEIPGPRSREIVARRDAAMPSGAARLTPIAVASAHGAVVTDVDGNRFLDFAGGIGTLALGHTPAAVVEAVQQQAGQLLHMCAIVASYEPMVAVAERLNAIVPGELPRRTVLMNSGAEAVETAVHICRSYTKRQGIVVFDGAYHGRTNMTLAMTSKFALFKKGYGPFAPEVYRLPVPEHLSSAGGDDRGGVGRLAHRAARARLHGDRRPAARGGGVHRAGARRGRVSPGAGEVAAAAAGAVRPARDAAGGR